MLHECYVKYNVVYMYIIYIYIYVCVCSLLFCNVIKCYMRVYKATLYIVIDSVVILLN